MKFKSISIAEKAMLKKHLKIIKMNMQVINVVINTG